jgi:ribosome biogenesis GTPase
VQLNNAEPLIGTVMAIQANYYQVWLNHFLQPKQGKTTLLTIDDTAPTDSILLCTRRSRLKKIGQQILVGDQVRVEEPDWLGQRGAIVEILPRTSQLDRPSIANVNQILLVFSLAAPEPDPYQLSRFLVAAELTGLKICVCFNKRDLVSTAQQHEWQARLEMWGYPAQVVSSFTGQGVSQLYSCFEQAVTVIAGPSGVGKSSLIRHLIPEAGVRIGTVSAKLSRGRHTTRHVELFKLATGGFLADTPGFNHPNLDCTPTQLGNCFPEIRQRLVQRSCQFNDCSHRHEPNCVVRGEWERYDHYLNFLDIILQQDTNRPSVTEAAMKLKIKQAGRSSYEPKLALKKYRQSSRRTQQQALQDLYRESH